MTSEAVDYLPGDVVKTSFGVGVIVRGIGSSNTTAPADEPPDHAASFFPSYKVLLWRIPGKSVGSSSTAYLQPSAVRYDTYASTYSPTQTKLLLTPHHSRYLVVLPSPPLDFGPAPSCPRNDHHLINERPRSEIYCQLLLCLPGCLFSDTLCHGSSASGRK